jgi:hypothetical protein
MKEIAENMNKCKDLIYSLLEECCKMSILPKTIYRFNALSIKISMSLLQKQKKNLHNMNNQTLE